MIITPFTPFDGQHCETTATGTLLHHIGIDMSEPMLFGLGEGLGFIYWKMKGMGAPFFGGRIKPDMLTENIARNLNLNLNVRETTSSKMAWSNVQELIDQGKPVGLKLDCYYLDYFTRKFHFAAHYVAMYGYDATSAVLVDTRQQGGMVRTSLDSLGRARAARGPMSSRNLYYTIEHNGKFSLKDSIVNAIRRNASDYLNPPIKNVGWKGIQKAALEVPKWFTASRNISDEFSSVAHMMEKAGTGGSLFRNLYRDFLREACEVHDLDQLRQAEQLFTEIASHWKNVSDFFFKIAATQNPSDVEAVSSLLYEIATKEKDAMTQLGDL